MKTHMEELGSGVQYHAKPKQTITFARLGKSLRFGKPLTKTTSRKKKYIGGPQTRAQFEETKEYTDGFFAQRPQLFASRIETTGFENVTEFTLEKYLSVARQNSAVRLY